MLVRRRAAEICGDGIVVQRIRGANRLGIAAQALDALRRATALPEPDQPERVEPASRQRGELLVGNLIETRHRAAVDARELIEPNVRALRDENGACHPLFVVAEPLDLGVLAGVA